MKKAYNRTRFITRIFWLFVCLFLFNFSSCGLDTFYVLDIPVSINNLPSTQNVDKTLNYFDFKIFETAFNGGFKFVGTDVYYKIYNSSSRLQSEVDYIDNLASNTSTSSTATSHLVNNYKYSKLKLEGNKYSTLIRNTSRDKSVIIRLTDYQETVDSKWASRVEVESVVQGKPFRDGVDETSFNFGRAADDYKLNKLPDSSDEDVRYTSDDDTKVWYVALFAVAVGRDTTFTEITGIPVYLGAVPIDTESRDN